MCTDHPQYSCSYNNNPCRMWEYARPRAAGGRAGPAAAPREPDRERERAGGRGPGVPEPHIGITRIGSPASNRIVPVDCIDAAACRAYRDLATTPKS